MTPDPIERDPDPIQSSHWQRDPPEEDGWYVVALDFPHRPQVNGSALHLARLGLDHQRRCRVAFSLSDGLADEVEDVSWWLLPDIDLPPIPEETP